MDIYNFISDSPYHGVYAIINDKWNDNWDDNILETEKFVKFDDIKDLKEKCQNYINFLKSDEYHEDGAEDFETYIFESAMELIFGKDVFDKVNKLIYLQEKSK